MAAVLTIVGVVMLIVWAQSARNQAFDGATLVEVYRVTADVPANASFETISNNAEPVALPQTAIPSGVVENLSDLQGLRSTVSLVAGEVLVRARFNESGVDGTTDASVPEGLQEVSVTLDVAEAVSGGVTPGSRVGVIALVETAMEPDSDVSPQRARIIAQEVLVTRVNDIDGGGTFVVTLAVDGQQATEISVAEQYGNVRLTAQNDDTNIDGGATVDLTQLVP